MLPVFEVNEMFLCVFMFLGPFVHAELKKNVLYWSILGFFFVNIKLKAWDFKIILVIYVKNYITDYTSALQLGIS